jgi:hypothetical protein
MAELPKGDLPHGERHPRPCMSPWGSLRLCLQPRLAASFAYAKKPVHEGSGGLWPARHGSFDGSTPGLEQPAAAATFRPIGGGDRPGSGAPER